MYETHRSGMFVFSHRFSLLWELSYLPCFRNCMGFYFTRNRVVRNISETETFGIFVFSHSFPVLSKFTIPMFWVFGTVWISASPKIWKKHLTFPMFGDNTTDVKTNENFLFLIPFSHKCLCEILHYFVLRPDPISAFSIPLS